MKITKLIALSAACCLIALSGVNRVVVIDAGHGGWDPGKVSAAGHEEKDINLAIVLYLQQFLESSGNIVVFTTRADDVALGDKKRADLMSRVNMPTDMQADIFVSIHQNAFAKASAKGAQTFYYENSLESKRLAELIQSRIKTSLDLENKMEAKANTVYFLLKETKTPAVIVECGFLTNTNEANKLITEEYQQKVAWAIYLGIMDYFADITVHALLKNHQ
ncbi:MAG: N-acetylmuramoyl-L-alanine amidase [Defluviitaleaceae bacterium]|nr:N-acetylmuramoyl-L-alanine amidase [Defluviitaleaceae bacterium]